MGRNVSFEGVRTSSSVGMELYCERMGCTLRVWFPGVMGVVLSGEEVALA